MREKGQTEVAKTLETPVFSRGIEILTEKFGFVPFVVYFPIQFQLFFLSEHKMFLEHRLLNIRLVAQVLLICTFLQAILY